MTSVRRSLSRSATLLALVAAMALSGCIIRGYDGRVVVVLVAGPDLEFALREAMINAKPDTIIEIPEGRFFFTDGLSLTVPHVMVRGQGMDKTILDFTPQTTGADAIRATADEVAFQDFAIENPNGDGIRIQGVTGAIVRRIRVEWTNWQTGTVEEKSQNGAYGVYPTRNTNVLVEGCIVRGAADAGLYMGQSINTIQRGNLVEGNVAGIEVENSINNDVYGNLARGNTAGILILEEPNLAMNGHTTRVFYNHMIDNNTVNFASGGTIALVPFGLGLLVFGGNNNEIFGNIIEDHGFTNIGIANYEITGNGYNPAQFDPIPEDVYIYDNILRNAGYDFGGIFNSFGTLAGFQFLPDAVPDIVTDGNQRLPNADLPLAEKICIQNNTDGNDAPVTFGNLVFPGGGGPLFNLEDFDCAQPSLTAVVLPFPGEAPEPQEEFTPQEIADLCNAAGDGINWDALQVNCPKISDYRLFVGNDPREIVDELLPYDLTMPLFSDYAQKYRSIGIPPGEVAYYDPSDSMDFPEGTVIVKTFTFLDDMRDPSVGEEIVETRLLVRRANGWEGIAYVWGYTRDVLCDGNPNEACPAVGGDVRAVSFIHTDGTARNTNYQIPNVNQCDNCHGEGVAGAAPIGPKARFLNRDFDYGVAEGAPSTVENQIDHWTDIGVLLNAPDSANAPMLPADDSLEQEARAYLEINCAHCHRAGGAAANTNLFLLASQPIPDPQYGYCKVPISAGAGAGGLTWDLVPGDSAQSIMVFRMNSDLPAAVMPELAKSLVHTEGVSLVADWIDSLEGGCN